MDPKLLERFNKMKVKTEDSLKKADETIDGLKRTIDKSRISRLQTQFQHLCEASSYLHAMLESAEYLVKKRKDTVPELHILGEKFEKRKNDQKIAETSAAVASGVSGALALSGVGAPVAAALAASSIIISLATQISVDILGKQDYDKFDYIINDDNCVSETFSKALERFSRELIFFQDCGMNENQVLYLIKTFKIKKNSKFSDISENEKNLDLLDFLSGDAISEKSFTDYRTTYDLKDAFDFGKKIVKLVLSCKKLYTLFSEWKKGADALETVNDFVKAPGFFQKIQNSAYNAVTKNMSPQSIEKMTKVINTAQKAFAVLGIGLSVYQIFSIWIYNETAPEKIMMDDIAEKLKDEVEYYNQIIQDISQIIG